MVTRRKLTEQEVEINKASTMLGSGKFGSMTKRIFSGISPTGKKPVIAPYGDENGLVFFVRPELNLTYDNLIKVRKLAPLLDDDPYSMNNALRTLLSPPDKRGLGDAKIYEELKALGLDEEAKKYMAVRSKIINDKQAFITPLTARLKSLTGWPSFAPETFTTEEGILKQQMSWIDSVEGTREVNDLTAEFYNDDTNGILDLLRVMVLYSTYVSSGVLSPFLEHQLARRIDYKIRIYRFVLASDGITIKNMACSKASFFTADPTAALYDYSDDSRVTDTLATVSVPVRCDGFIYEDPKIIDWFNRTVVHYNYDMHLKHRKDRMVKLSIDEYPLYEYLCYPLITTSKKMEWWVSKEVYETGVLSNDKA